MRPAGVPVNSPHRLVGSPNVPPDISQRLCTDFDRFAEGGLPSDLEEYLLEAYGLDVATTYAGLLLKNPWGKASGQLSMRPEQVVDDVAAGLGFVVLKTVIAQDASGTQTMKDWAVRESHMLAERIRGKSGAQGWTVSWKGRGWWQTFDEYLELVRQSRELAEPAGTLVVPSCKFHLPTPDEQTWNVEEYRYTMRRLLEAYGAATPVRQRNGQKPTAMPLEKDFSPTLAGSDRAAVEAKVLEWLRTVPRLVREAVADSVPVQDDVQSDRSGRTLNAVEPPVRIGLKLFNALFNDDFQVRMLRCLHDAGPDRPDFVVYCNRLFDPDRVFEGHRGIAYGGPDLSDRNLRVLDAFLSEARAGAVTLPLLETSATGDIHSGRMAMEYALRGCSSFQLHTLFQLPADQYVMRTGNKTQKALHLLYFHPEDGLVAWMQHVGERLGLGESGPIRLREIVSAARQAAAEPPLGAR